MPAFSGRRVSSRDRSEVSITVRMPDKRRSILIASCMLTGAAFTRFVGLSSQYYYVDLLILLGVLRDLIVNKRVHPVYLYGLPVLIVTETTAIHLFLAAPAWWVRITDAILRVS